ncbi:SDR family NAD(P)-dependent oxidoreductase [Cohnella sp.]|uniref:SDR family NAD(P)-dependent oxidoreductase n=1 Tax=Cohnella sp. TaxID=1883426 RepID=UPI00356A87F2
MRDKIKELVKRGEGLIVEVTDGYDYRYRGNLPPYSLAKVSVIHLAEAQAAELRPHGVAAVAVTPGFLRSEEMLDYFGVSEANWRDGATKEPHFLQSETPFFLARGLAALAAEPDLLSKSGKAYTSWGLSDDYGIEDVDGRRPHWGNYAAEQGL